jgi:hypothetical protein
LILDLQFGIHLNNNNQEGESEDEYIENEFGDERL